MGDSEVPKKKRIVVKSHSAVFFGVDCARRLKGREVAIRPQHMLRKKKTAGLL
jgi:hypothetical protein